MVVLYVEEPISLVLGELKERGYEIDPPYINTIDEPETREELEEFLRELEESEEVYIVALDQGAGGWGEYYRVPGADPQLLGKELDEIEKELLY